MIAVVTAVPLQVRFFLVNHIVNFHKRYEITIISNLLIQNNLSDINNIIDLEPNQSKLLNSFIGGIKSLSEELKSIKKDVNEFSKQFTFNYKI